MADPNGQDRLLQQTGLRQTNRLLRSKMRLVFFSWSNSMKQRTYSINSKVRKGMRSSRFTFVCE